MKFLLMFYLIIQLVIPLQGPQDDCVSKEGRSLFVWEPQKISQSVLTQLEDEGITTLYIHFAECETEDFLRAADLATKANMDVQVLGGSYRWVREESEGLKDFLSCLEDLLKEKQLKVSGIILDIEPYVIDVSDDQMNQYYGRFQALIQEAKAFTGANDLTLNVVVPFWYEKIKVDDQGTGADNLAEWVFMTSDDVTVMAYRNTLFGKNSITQLIQEEIQYSKENDANLIVAIETRPSREGDHISFDDHTFKEVMVVVCELEKYLGVHAKGVSVSIHHLESWLELSRH